MTLIGNDLLREISGGTSFLHLSEEDHELLDDLMYTLETAESREDTELALEELRNFNRIMFRKYGH